MLLFRRYDSAVVKLSPQEMQLKHPLRRPHRLI